MSAGHRISGTFVLLSYKFFPYLHDIFDMIMLDFYDQIVKCFFVWPYRETEFLNSSTSSTRWKWLYWYALWCVKSYWGHL